MSILKYFLVLLSVLSFQGCTYRIVTDYSECVSSELTFEFKEDLNLFLIDDSDGEHKYSSMNLPKGEYYICVGEGDQCMKDYAGQYSRGWKLIPIHPEPFHLTGKYKTNVPNLILGAFASETEALQANIAGKNVWLPVYVLDERKLGASSKESINALNKNTTLINGWLPDFKCPNTDVKEEGWELVWFY